VSRQAFAFVARPWACDSSCERKYRRSTAGRRSGSDRRTRSKTMGAAMERRDNTVQGNADPNPVDARYKIPDRIREFHCRDGLFSRGILSETPGGQLHLMLDFEEADTRVNLI